MKYSPEVHALRAELQEAVTYVTELRLTAEFIREIVSDLYSFRPGNMSLVSALTVLHELELDATPCAATEDDQPHVCPGCHAVAPERCLPGCIDDEIETENRNALENGDYDSTGDDDE